MAITARAIGGQQERRDRQLERVETRIQTLEGRMGIGPGAFPQEEYDRLQREAANLRRVIGQSAGQRAGTTGLPATPQFYEAGQAAPPEYYPSGAGAFQPEFHEAPDWERPEYYPAAAGEGMEPPGYYQPGAPTTEAQFYGFEGDRPELGGVPGSGPEGDMPRFYGFEHFPELEAELFKEQMAMVSPEFGRRGTMSSSMYAAAAVTAATGAQRTRWGLEAAELARRTTWEQEVAFEQWRHQAQAQGVEAQLGMRWAELQAGEAGRRTQWQQQLHLAEADRLEREAVRQTDWAAQQDLLERAEAEREAARRTTWEQTMALEEVAQSEREAQRRTSWEAEQAFRAASLAEAEAQRLTAWEQAQFQFEAQLGERVAERRTAHERDVAFEEWRQGEVQRQFNIQQQQARADRAAQREQQEAEYRRSWAQWFGEMEQEDYWNAADRMLEAIPMNPGGMGGGPAVAGGPAAEMAAPAAESGVPQRGRREQLEQLQSWTETYPSAKMLPELLNEAWQRPYS